MDGREALEPSQSSLEQRARSARITTAVVVEGRRDLNDSLQKSLLRLGRGEPNFFPGLMRLKKEPRVKLLDPPAKLFPMFSVIEVFRHSFTATARGRLGSRLEAKPLWYCGKPSERAGLPKFHLVLLFHSHQPIGNFDHVYESTFQRSYLPFVQHLQRHPNVRVGLHYSGPLLEWIERHHPEFLDFLRELVTRGQVEMVSGGFYEPILISIPPEDQADQLARMARYLEEKFGAVPTGAWLAERVWEPQLPFVLSTSGIRYTLVDDVHFIAAGFEYSQLHGDYICEDRGRTVRVLPGLKKLRYLLPFRSLEESFGYLRECADTHPGGMAAMGDDCEKFGAWPETYDYCYAPGTGWVEQFFSALEASSDWLVTTPPGEWIASHAPIGRADLPTASYAEMMEWTLPTQARREFKAIREEFASRPEVLKFMRGGHWRAFFTKYAESNLLHQKMLHASARLRVLAESKPAGKRKLAKLEAARTHVLRAQCNDAYWHGVFGGLYAPHLRTELWRELICAEALAENISTDGSDSPRVERFDFDADGLEELCVTSPRMAALIRPSDGATIGALDCRTAGATLINSMQRRVEAYHNRLNETFSARRNQVASIHERLAVKEKGLERLLRYDRWPRNSFRLLFFSGEKTFEDYSELRLQEHAALAGGNYTIKEQRMPCVRLELRAPHVEGDSSSVHPGELRCSKLFSFAHEGSGFRIDCATELSARRGSSLHGQIGIELILNFLAPNAPDRYFELPTGHQPLNWAGPVPAAALRSGTLRLVDEWQNVAATIKSPSAAHFWIAPIETVSESDEGFERVYQGSQILLVWPVDLAGDAAWSGEATLHIELLHTRSEKNKADREPRRSS